MGYIIIDEEKLKEAISLWNNQSYKQQVKGDINRAEVDASHLLEVLQQEEKEINNRIQSLEARRNNLSKLMKFAKSKF